MRKNNLVRWFLEPRTPDVNEAIMAELASTCGATAENIHREKIDDKGAPHNVVEIEYIFVTNIERNRNMRDLYRVYVQQEGRSTMRLWAFGGQSNLSRTREVRKVAQKIDELRGKQKV